MTIYLRQSTASQEIPLGYFVDSTDGNTEETALSIANTDIKIWKTGATTLANKNSGGATHISNGIYHATLDATDTDTIGPLVIFVHVTGALTARQECVVLDEAVYDVLFGTAALTTGGAITVTSGRVNADVTHIATAAVSTSTAQLGVNVVNAAGTAWGSGAITAASIAADAITAAKIAANAIDADAIAADAVTEIQSGLSTLDAAGVRTAVGLASANLDTQLTAIDDFLDTEVAAIKAKTDQLTFTVANVVDANSLRISGSSESADRLERSTLAIVTGTCDAGGTTTAIIASALSPTSAVNDQFNGRIITFDKDTTTAALRGQATDITDYVHATLTFTVTALTTAPASGDTFTIT